MIFDQINRLDSRTIKRGQFHLLDVLKCHSAQTITFHAYRKIVFEKVERPERKSLMEMANYA
jgi:hypothetical protein